MGLERPSSLPSSENSRAKFSVFYIFLLCVVLCALTTFITPSSLSSPYIRNSKSGKLGQFDAQVLGDCDGMSRLTGPSDSLQHTKTRTVLDFGPFTTCGSMPWLFLRFDLNRVEEGKGTLVMIKKMKKTGDRSNAAGERRILRGLGSSPPRCLSKCGRCTPCKPVHVPVPPGTPVTAEYYPEAWRCKCGNKLYMP
ncbi:hypothetical protein HID58_062576 [Brassica napus]|uniref:Epidermal patterning factor-like protein n=2 Tax=Brassica TaxID=3705 RepID=A0ABQ8A324_BRANA|nr:hypothetical protein HID58_062576 [Brassica napus]